ncbi:MAG: phosphodiester glycosidase family protein [Clostridia bacterium]|nr:phosphodiester glycosidase family protein [Clostridia bacterium]
MKGVRRSLSLFLCLALALGMVFGYAQSACAADLSELLTKSIAINDQLELVTNVNYNAAAKGNAVENYFSYRPGKNVVPIVSFGEAVYGAQSASDVFSLEKQAGNPVVGLTNGDFFVLATGLSLGPVIRDGIVRAGGYSEPVLGFGEEGDVYIGDPNLNVAIAFTDRDVAFDRINFNKGINKNNGIGVYTTDYGQETGAGLDTFNVVVRVEEGEACLGGALKGVVERAFSGKESVTLEKGMFLACMAMETPYESTLEILQNLEIGEHIQLDFKASDDFLGIQNAIGFESWLVQDGDIRTGLDSSSRAPRTAAGVKRDGSFILYTVDGRQSGYSMGFTLAELAARMKALGCVQAVNLDGGASTQLFAQLPGDFAQQQINQDSDRYGIRSCSNYICFVNRAKEKGVARHLHIYPYGEYLLCGASMELTVKATDENYFPTSVPASVSYGSTHLGSVRDNVFTAGNREGVCEINAKGGKAKGTVTVNIIRDPDSVTALIDGKAATATLTLSPGAQVQLSTSAMYHGFDLRSDANCYKWKVSGDIGEIDENGVFTANPAGGESGTITVSAGHAEAEIAVTVKKTIPTEELQAWMRELADRAAEQALQDIPAKP